MSLPPKMKVKLGTESVSVRMYRGLLGDCFLLTHTAVDDASGVSHTFRALIDCGVLQCIGAAGSKPNTKAAVGHMAAVVASLARDTKPSADAKSELDLVIATHEHYDHLSGFLLQFDAFKEFTIKAVWLAWTENDQDGLAKDINLNGKKALAALVKAAAASAFAVSDEGRRRGEAIVNLGQFGFTWPGLSPDDPAAAAPVHERVERPEEGQSKTSLRSCKAVLNWLKTRPCDPKAVRYLEPGEVVQFGIGGRLIAHVLGPPRRADRLLKLNPTEGGKVEREVYLAKPDDVAALETTLRVLEGASMGGGRIGGGVDYPFSPRFDRATAAIDACDVAKLYYSQDTLEAARRIDGEWLGTAESLAMKIDGDVNNTSLALAIEVPGRDVLLFPADAQVGNWLSWHDQVYPLKPEAKDTPTVTAEDLLRRTIFYKVGHHGSHNATARAKGLELMTSPDLVAMIPVVKSIAAEQKTSSNPKGWAMPYADLNKRLKERTRERIIQGDGDRVTELANFDGKKSRFKLSYADTTKDPLWAELTLPLSAP